MVCTTASKSMSLGPELAPDKKAFLKNIPKLQLEKMGFGDLDFDNDEDNFLSESSISEGDFELLRSDNFYDMVKQIQEDFKD